MLSSIQCGLGSIENKSSYLIALGDQPQQNNQQYLGYLKKHL